MKINISRSFNEIENKGLWSAEYLSIMHQAGIHMHKNSSGVISKQIL